MDTVQHSANLALAAYAETFLTGRRVVVFGDASTGLAQLLIERGARLVHVYDRDPVRVGRATAAAAHPGISYAVLGESGLPVRDGAFEVGFITNLASHAQPEELVNRLRKALSARGVGFIAVPNAERTPSFEAAPQHQGLGYYELYDLACGEFDEVRTLGQTPFAGYALADFGPDREESFSIDTAFVPGGAEEPEWFVAVVSHFPVQCEPFSVIQFPVAELLESVLTQREAPALQGAAVQPPAQAALAAQQASEHAALTRDNGEVRTLLAEARAELEKRDAWAAELEVRCARLEALANAAQAEARAADEDAQALRARLDADRQRSGELDRLRADLDAEVTSLRREASRLKHEVTAAAERERKLREEHRELRAQVEQSKELSATAARLEAELEATRAQAAAAEQIRAEFETDNQQQEALLRERAEYIRQMGRDLRATERFAEQLVRELETAREGLSAVPSSQAANELATQASGTVTAAPTPALSAEPDPQLTLLERRVAELAQTEARHVADLTAAQWTIRALENRLLESAPSEHLLADLEQARAELQRQRTLLSQLAQAQSTHEAPNGGANPTPGPDGPGALAGG